MSDRHFQRAYSTHMSGDRQAARDLYERILKKTPKHVDARYMLGTLLAESGELELALTHLKAAAIRMPNSPMIHTNLGNVYLKLGKLDLASDCYQRSLKLDPLVPETLFNLGAIFHQQGKLEDAATYIESSLEIKPNFPAAYFKLSKIYREQNHPDLAAACFIKVLADDPDSIEALFELGNIYAAHQDYANAAFYFKRILEIDPGNDSARHAVAALSGETTTTAPAAHVEQLFDEMSESFESHLDQLGYRAPEMLKEMLIALAGDKVHFDRAIDLGCGTGLSGVQFRTMVTHLTGLDLSQKMVDLVPVQKASMMNWQRAISANTWNHRNNNTTCSSPPTFLSTLANYQTFSKQSGHMRDRMPISSSRLKWRWNRTTSFVRLVDMPTHGITSKCWRTRTALPSHHPAPLTCAWKVSNRSKENCLC